MSTVPTLDLVLIIVVMVSAVIGLARGFFREILSLVIWGGAFVAALSFGEVLGERIGTQVGEPLGGVLGFVGVFIGVLILGALVQWGFAKLVESTGLTGTDRLVGFLFGTARGIVVCTVAIIALRPFFEDALWWRVSVFRPELAKVERSILDILTQTREYATDPEAPEAPNAESPPSSRSAANPSGSGSA